MERVTFLLERTGERIPCLLNPESFEQTRVAGVKPRRSLSGVLASAAHGDQPLLFTGGGTTELELDLLFDVSLVRPPRELADVRELTGPLWRLAENGEDDQGRPRPPLLRFLWGTTWNVPGIVAAVAERLEYFTAEGVPRRSWLRLRFRRVSPPPPPPPGALPGEGLAIPPELLESGGSPFDPPFLPDPFDPVHVLVGGRGDEEGTPEAGGERLDVIAGRHYGDAALWRAIAAFNRIADPLRIAAGTTLRLPPLARLLRGS